ncbi:MAG: hypothetical protein L3J65_08235 [Robiginitomaculum sp.]|nr:hypothetical protein [Robiginitomaculum sp.]
MAKKKNKFKGAFGDNLSDQLNWQGGSDQANKQDGVWAWVLFAHRFSRRGRDGIYAN